MKSQFLPPAPGAGLGAGPAGGDRIPALGETRDPPVPGDSPAQRARWVPCSGIALSKQKMQEIRVVRISFFLLLLQPREILLLNIPNLIHLWYRCTKIN